MPKRSKRWSDVEETFFNRARNDELRPPSKRLLASRAYKAATDISEENNAYPIPLPFVDEINDMFRHSPIPTKSESINFGAENIFTDSETTSTIPLPASPDKPSSSCAFTFPDSPILGIASILTDSESVSSETSEDELASVSSCQSATTTKTLKRSTTRSEYYRQRLNQIDREQQDRRERWKKKLEIMEKLLNK